MIRKCICMLGVIWIVMILLLPVKGVDRKGSLRVMPMWGGEQILGGEVSICLVGCKTEDGYLLTDGLANWSVSEKEVLTGNWISWLSERTAGRGICNPIEPGGGAEFTGLQEGLYLVQQLDAPEGFDAFHPFVVAIPENGEWNVYKEPEMVCLGESPQTGDRPAPIIGAMGLGLSAVLLMIVVDERKK